MNRVDHTPLRLRTIKGCFEFHGILPPFPLHASFRRKLRKVVVQVEDLVISPFVEKACERFEKLGVQFKKRPTDGKMRHIAFILDPDG